jgi:hypothetical protein
MTQIAKFKDFAHPHQATKTGGKYRYDVVEFILGARPQTPWVRFADFGWVRKTADWRSSIW